MVDQYHNYNCKLGIINRDLDYDNDFVKGIILFLILLFTKGYPHDYWKPPDWLRWLQDSCCQKKSWLISRVKSSFSWCEECGLYPSKTNIQYNIYVYIYIYVYMYIYVCIYIYVYIGYVMFTTKRWFFARLEMMLTQYENIYIYMGLCVYVRLKTPNKCNLYRESEFF